MKQSYSVRLVATIFVLSLLAVSLSACDQIPGLGAAAAPRAAGTTGGRAVTVSVQPVKEGPISLILSYAGAVQAVDQVNVVSKVSGRIEKTFVNTGSVVKAGDLLATLDRASLEPNVKQADAGLAVAQARLATIQAGSRPEDIASAEAALTSARAKLAQVRAGPTSADLQAAQGSVASAQSTLAKAQNDFQKLKSAPTSDDLRSAQLLLDKAKNSLYSTQMARDSACGNNKETSQCRTQDGLVNAAQTTLDLAMVDFEKVKAGPKPDDIAVSQQAVDSAQAQLTSAQAKLAQLRSQPSNEDIQIATAAVTQAESQLSLKKTPYTERDVQTAQAQIAQAQATLDAAKSQLNETNVVAPFDGVIAQKLLDAGSMASGQSALFVLSTSAVEIQIAVEESRLGFIEVGQPTSLSLAAFSGTTFPAKIASISPVADTKTHTFAVKVVPDEQSGKLKSGMFADVKITARQNPKAVLAPKEAIIDRAGKSIVFVIADSKAVSRDIKIGLSDDKQVEAISGLEAGESIVVSGQASLNDGDSVRLAGQIGGQSPAKPGAVTTGTPQAPGKPPQGGPAAKPDSGAKPASDTTPAPTK